MNMNTNANLSFPQFILNWLYDLLHIDNSDNRDSIDTEKDVYTENGVSSSSLLDNKAFVKLFAECADIINELEKLSPRFNTAENKLLLELINDRLRQALFLAGGKPICNDECFDSRLHYCLENISAKDGTKIETTIESGIRLEERVFVKSKVKLNSSQS